MSCLKIQLRIIGALETIISLCLLTLNVKILLELIIRKDEIKPDELGEFKDLSVSALIVFFLIRILYLIGEFLLAIFLNFWVYTENLSGLQVWFTMTILFSIASRCYFIGGIIWGRFFIITLITFLANLAFTIYSLITVYFYVKQAIQSEPRDVVNINSFYEMV